MRYFEILFYLLFIGAFIGVLAGAHHQIVIMILSTGMIYTLKTQKDESQQRNRRV